ncbi:3-isopropylmalate dehydratase small subunit [Ktedonosporobacter rubrisoli]|uniref:3-isopropylmalate dehydratase small subunit n=1 Tax=Ktedonosporobacter rubrisoli TaxID=2509675 RepID=A0A4P6JWF3_KTERU|nr:3-isopropylmalate dehydratase small subunit [Ktedonosporobacter rubrisoli]QBD79336.1 3-isopropylmalate dehydratase small subunit [Ktedonosporobacter rubrisoli]
MEPFVKLTGLVAPLDRTNVNTDEITPARFLKSIKRTGFAEALFANWRFQADGSPNPDFVLNKPRYQGATILVAGDNFGCGSSREHAPWSIREYGFRCLIAPSFADIFYNNCFNNSILPVTLPEETVSQLFKEIEANEGYTLSVDLEAQTITRPDGSALSFELDQFRKQALLKGLDNVGWTLSHNNEIAAYEARRKQDAPWVYIGGAR